MSDVIEFSSSACSDDRFIVEIEGHADHGPEGCDIVCAAASILALDILDIAKGAEKRGETVSFYSSAGKGNLSLDVQFRRGFAENFRAALDAIENGFLLLEANYPECVICT